MGYQQSQGRLLGRARILFDMVFFVGVFKVSPFATSCVMITENNVLLVHAKFT